MKTLKIFSIIFFIITLLAEAYALMLLITSISTVLDNDAGGQILSIIALLPMFILVSIGVGILAIVETILVNLHSKKSEENELEASGFLRACVILSWIFVVINILGFSFFYLYPAIKG